MGHSNAPTTYYSTLHHSITSLCKTILPLGIKNRCLVSAENRLLKLKSDNLKWQQETFHQMLKLMGLHQEDILPEAEVSAFRTHLLDTLLASPPPQQDHALILRDKLVFLQELLNAKCISEGEYNSSKRPLLQRLKAQGGDIEGKDVIIAGSKDIKQNPEEEWSVIDLKDEQCLMNKENSNSKKKSKKAKKHIKGATSVFSFGSSYKPGKNSMEKSIFDSPSLQMHSAHSIVPPSTIYAKNELRKSKENNPFWDGSEKCKRKPFRIPFHRENKDGHSGGDHGLGLEETAGKSAKKQWGFDVLKKWKRNDFDDENDITPLSLNEKSDSEAYLASYQLGEGSETKLMKNKLHSDRSPSDFCIGEKVPVDKINKELSIIKTEPRSTNTNLKFSPLCDRYGGVVLDEAEKEFKDQMRKDAEEKHELSMGWTTFEDDENLHPNLFVHQDNYSLRSSSINPFSHC